MKKRHPEGTRPRQGENKRRLAMKDKALTNFILAAHRFLVWLDQKTEPYQQASKTFLDKRPTLRTMLLRVGPVVLPPLGVIVAALLT